MLLKWVNKKMKDNNQLEQVAGINGIRILSVEKKHLSQRSRIYRAQSAFKTFYLPFELVYFF
jgi:hypothetical protein